MRIKRDDDGTIFVDYLGGMQREVRSLEDHIDMVRIHKNFVEERIASFAKNTRVLSKYLWLKKYHNAVVQSRFSEEFHEQLSVVVPETNAEIKPIFGNEE